MNYNKKTYIAPDLEFLANETMLMVNTWYVDKNNDDPFWKRTIKKIGRTSSLIKALATMATTTRGMQTTGKTPYNTVIIT